MIRSFRHKGLSELFEKGKSRRVAPDPRERIMRRLDVLKGATTLPALNVPGFNFHQLTGQAKGEPIRYSIHVNGPWTLRFEWDAKAGEAVGVDLVQYH